MATVQHIQGELFRTNQHLSKEQERSIAAEYAAGGQSSDIGRRRGLRQARVMGAVHRCGVPARDKYTCGRKRALNQRFFATIDSEATAWLLGFITADGGIHAATRQLSIGVSRKDREVLEMIRNLLCSDAPITDYETLRPKELRFYSRITFNSKKKKAAPVKADKAKKEKKWGVSFCGNLAMVSAFMGQRPCFNANGYSPTGEHLSSGLSGIGTSARGFCLALYRINGSPEPQEIACRRACRHYSTACASIPFLALSLNDKHDCFEDSAAADLS